MFKRFLSSFRGWKQYCTLRNIENIIIKAYHSYSLTCTDHPDLTPSSSPHTWSMSQVQIWHFEDIGRWRWSKKVLLRNCPFTFFSLIKITAKICKRNERIEHEKVKKRNGKQRQVKRRTGNIRKAKKRNLKKTTEKNRTDQKTSRTLCVFEI